MMKEKKIVICLLVILSTLTAFGQTSIRGNIASSLKETMLQKYNQGTKLVIKKVEKRNIKGQIIKADTLYYRDIVRKYGWLEGLGSPIPLSTARHLPYYYRMSMRNSMGHWQHVEAMHGNSMTTNHPIGTYIIDKLQTDDAQANKEWVELLNSVTQWFFSTNHEGDEVYEERSYDSNNNMVYSFSSVRNQDGRVTGSYNDAWGRPADMREDSTTTYGSVVCITYDRNGCDSIIDFLDGQGLRKKNNNGVDQSRFIYDDDGYVLEAKSCNSVGDYIQDNWGNCGYSITYDHQKGLRSKIYRNKEWKPIRMPAIRASAEQTFIRCDYIKDQWGRDSLATMLTFEGVPDTTHKGIHQIRYNYKNDGTLLSKTYYDINGNIIRQK